MRQHQRRPFYSGVIRGALPAAERKGPKSRVLWNRLRDHFEMGIHNIELFNHKQFVIRMIFFCPLGMTCEACEACFPGLDDALFVSPIEN